MANAIFAYLAKYITLSEEERETITSLNLFRSYKKGDVLLKAGQRSNDSYFVVKGCIRCYYVVDGEEKTTAFYTESEPLSPPCAISKEPSAQYVACVEDAILAVSDPGMEAMVFERFPRFETLCRILSEELLAKSQHSSDHFKTSSPEQRYLNLLQTRPDLVQRVPQYQLASYLGITDLTQRVVVAAGSSL
ncbi:MAG: Crp/Fnr family transcriptional regulator [Hymenobacteraceae bacterium]|nr:Crp/Fnr family transcriptional regulator [Hymenobacteraceae bacterium]